MPKLSPDSAVCRKQQLEGVLKRKLRSAEAPGVPSFYGINQVTVTHKALAGKARLSAIQNFALIIRAYSKARPQSNPGKGKVKPKGAP
jgi:hypothetical protein